jgi:P27 family predicted phage terminase small subunit
MKTNKPPKHLSKEAKDIWKRINDEWELDASGVVILTTALEGFGEMRKAQALVEKFGLIIKTKTGQLKKNPAVEMIKISRGQFLHAWKMIGFNIEPPNESLGRPPGDRRRYGNG